MSSYIDKYGHHVTADVILKEKDIFHFNWTLIQLVKNGSKNKSVEFIFLERITLS